MLTQDSGRTAPSRRPEEDLVLTTITHHADALLRTARRHSLCADDASDAYQRGLEIFLRNAGRVDPARAAAWLHTVIKHEAMAVRRSRQKLVGAEEFDGDAVEALHAPAPDERMLAFEDVTRAAEALQSLKPQEVQALWMRMEGRTYKEIAAELGWTYTKVNRCVTEGRRAFLSRYAGIESGEECRRFESAISAFVDGELGKGELGALRRHLRGCGGCRGTLRTLRSGQRALQAVLPVGLVAAGADAGEPAVGVFVRVYETVVGSLQERAVVLATKAQLAVEATGVAKVAAVAGATAAVAGGGAATVERVAADQSREPARHEQARATASAQRPASVTAPAAQRAVTRAAPPKAAPVVVRRTEPPAPGRDRRPATEFAVERAVAAQPTRTPAAPAPHPSAPRPPEPLAATAGGEFGIEP